MLISKIIFKNKKNIILMISERKTLWKTSANILLNTSLEDSKCGAAHHSCIQCFSWLSNIFYEFLGKCKIYGDMIF